jgi:hypothetical protein
MMTLAALVLGIAAAGGAKADSREGYAAALAAPLPAPRQEIIEGVLWKCAGAHCAAPSRSSRPALVCRRVARAFGQVARFASAAGELSAEELARCNGSD